MASKVAFIIGPTKKMKATARNGSESIRYATVRIQKPAYSIPGAGPGFGAAGGGAHEVAMGAF
jgi:hypothetical protein